MSVVNDEPDDDPAEKHAGDLRSVNVYAPRLDWQAAEYNDEL